MAQPLKRFENDTTEVLLNPRLLDSERLKIKNAVAAQSLPGHLWLMSSGTESSVHEKIKLVGLSKTAMLTAAQSVVDEFSLQSSDVYLNAVPDFHVGGLAVEARAHIGGFKVESLGNFAWNVEKYVDILETSCVTVSSLVPTQIYDLIQAQKQAPKKLRIVFVGGGALSHALYEAAKSLGWPLILTYGMTETCAMLAMASSTSEGLRRYKHVTDWSQDPQGRLRFLSPALLTGYLFVGREGRSEFVDPKIEGWYHSDDRGRITGERLFLEGRESELVKINGESVSLRDLQMQWEHFALQNSLAGPHYIIAREEPRSGFELLIVSEKNLDEAQLRKFNEDKLPFARVHKAFTLGQVPRSPTGKILRHRIIAEIAQLTPQISL